MTVTELLAQRLTLTSTVEDDGGGEAGCVVVVLRVPASFTSGIDAAKRESLGRELMALVEAEMT